MYPQPNRMTTSNSSSSTTTSATTSATKTPTLNQLQKNDIPITTSKWLTWAKEEVQLQKTETHSPKITHTRPTQVASVLPKQPTKEQLELILFDSPQCFCKKKAHLSYTLEYGPILECASYGYKEQDKEKYQRKYTCGFHVHELSWKKFCNDLKQGQTIQNDYIELRACPLYNFTFCTMFYLTNHYDKMPPTVLPNCFCGHPVKLRERNYKLYFTCQSSNKDGVKKCSWRLEANQVVFTKPKHRLHTFVDFETYQTHLEKPVSPVVKSQHQNDLLATLSAKPNSNCNRLVVPTSVLAKKPTISSSSSTSTCSTLSSPIMNKMVYDLEEAKTINTSLRLSILQLKQEAQEAESKLLDCMEKMKSIELNCQEKNSKMKLELQQENLLRISCQERLSSIEFDIIDLSNQKDKAIDDLADFKAFTSIKYGKEEEFNKCKVCFNRPIEYVLLPCFHFAYCQLCASKLKECALCRRSITTIQKIYTC